MPGHYTTPEDLVYEINSAIIDAVNGFEDDAAREALIDDRLFLHFDYRRKKVWMGVPFGFGVFLNEEVAEMLGFKENAWFAKEVADQILPFEKMEAEYHPDMKMIKSALYVYCNVVEPQIVGDRRYKLLNHVAVNNQGPGENTLVEIARHHYLPVSRNHIPEIEVDITDDAGRSIRFERGKVITTLHFRRRL